MALASSLRDFADSPLDLNDDEELTDDAVVYNLKYLGSTILTPTKAAEETKTKIKFSKKSSLATTSAIKKIIAMSKSQKKLSDVTISITPKGIESFEVMTEEPILQIPIYKISYCSVDAAHDTIFSFVSSSSEEGDENNFQSNHFGSPDSPSGQLEATSIEDEGNLMVHAFQCNKRKIAHQVTICVARAFERAFQIYQSEQVLKEIHDKKSTNKENMISETEKNAVNIKKLIANNNNGKDEKCLIDLDEAPQLNHLYSKESNREYLQTTWVSFE